MAIYFIPGLGGNAYHAQEFLEALPVKATVLELPLDKQYLENLPALHAWFEQHVDLSDEVVLIGHSIGADIVAYLASRYDRVSKAILLDGAIWTEEVLGDVDDEVVQALAYWDQTCFPSLEEAIAIEKAEAPYWSRALEKAVEASLVKTETGYRLSLSREGLPYLLRLRRKLLGAIQKLSPDCTLLIVPDLGEETPAFKQGLLAALPAGIEVQKVADCGHSLYTEKPRQVARLVTDFLT